jgi:hypothetical protein
VLIRRPTGIHIPNAVAERDEHYEGQTAIHNRSPEKNTWEDVGSILQLLRHVRFTTVSFFVQAQRIVLTHPQHLLQATAPRSQRCL